MKKLLFLLAIAILGIGGYVFYQKKNQLSNTITSFIPDNTLVLLETNEISAEKNKTLSNIPLLSQATVQFQFLSQIGLSDKEIKALLLKKTLYFAVLPDGKDNFAFVNYLPLNTERQKFIEKIEHFNQSDHTNRIITHTTQGFKISEVFDKNAKLIFAFIVQDDFLIFSSSNLVLEEAVIHANNNWVSTLPLKKNTIKSDSIFTKTHFNTASINVFLHDVTNEERQNIFPKLLSNSYQWLPPKGDVMEAIGSTNEDKLFEGQKVSKIQCLDMIPNSSSYILNISFSNPKNLFKNIEQQIEHQDKISKLRNKAASAFDYDYSDIYEKIKNEITLCSFDISDQTLHSKVLIIKQNDLHKTLSTIAKNVADKSNENIFSVQYGSFSITALGIKEFPSMLLGSPYQGFEECYFTQYNDYLILASSLSMMQDYLLNVSKGDVWSYSAKNKTILSHCSPSNLTFIAENSKAFKGLGKILNSRWSAKLNNNEQAFSEVQAEILQQNSVRSSIVLLKNIEPIKTAVKFENKWIQLGSNPVTAQNEPLYLVNPSTKNTEILVQGNDNKLSLYENGKNVWKYQLADKIIGQIKNIAITKGNSQQLLIITSSKIYVLNRITKGFDVKSSSNLANINFDYYNLFENEADKNENLTLVTENGESFKINKATLAIKPFRRVIHSQTIAPMPSVIIKGSENVVILEKSGNLYLQNAQGIIAPGFPIKLKTSFSSAPILDGENNNIIIRLLSEKGELFKISIEGKILEKKQLFRSYNEEKFMLVSDSRNSDWVILRTDDKVVYVLDKHEKEIFSIKDLGYGKKGLKYYNLGTAGKYFAITNGYTTYRLYNELGKFVGTLPIESEYPPNISYSDSYKKIIMNITTPSSIETWSIKIH